MRIAKSLSSAAILLNICLAPVLAWAGTVQEIPPGTDVRVRVTENLSSATARVGDIFHGTLEEAIAVNGKQVYPKGADVSGTVVAVHSSGRLTDPGELTLILNTISAAGVASSISVEPFHIKGESHTKSNVGKIGGASALGALIGAVAGGGKGAAIGAGVGAAAGTAGAAATGKKEAIVEAEAVLRFVASQNPANPAATTPSAGPAQPEREEKSAADRSFDNAVLFTARDRRVIRNCVNEHSGELAAGVTQRDELPSGAERQVRVGGTLSPALQKKAASLPLACEQQLPRLPADQERVVYGGRVLLLDSSSRILDLFSLEESK